MVTQVCEYTKTTELGELFYMRISLDKAGTKKLIIKYFILLI